MATQNPTYFYKPVSNQTSPLKRHFQHMTHMLFPYTSINPTCKVICDAKSCWNFQHNMSICEIKCRKQDVTMEAVQELVLDLAHSFASNIKCKGMFNTLGKEIMSHHLPWCLIISHHLSHCMIMSHHLPDLVHSTFVHRFDKCISI